jgi:nucleoside-diphosphate-sugar epimerase
MGGRTGDDSLKFVIFGLGYSALHFAQTHGASFATTATVTTHEQAHALTRDGLDVLVFSPEENDALLQERIANADALLISIPPDQTGDPVLAAFRETIARAKNLKHIVYLSTLGVYGDHFGAWVDETSRCKPSNERSQWRLAAENDWLALGAATGKAVHVLRLAGIYGPGQNALVNLRNGTARRIIKPGQVFNRIHVEDIARAIAACLKHDGGGVWNVSDNEPAPAEDVVTDAAQLLGVEPPPAVRYEDAQMSPMARSFYAETKRASNRAMKAQLGVELAYPSYREALRAMWAAGDGRV